MANEWDAQREWVLSELRALRDRAAAEREHVNERFKTVNELRAQVLEERGVYVRHEVVEALRSRLEHLEQEGIRREDHDRLVDRVVTIEKGLVTREEHVVVLDRIASLQSRVPLLVSIAAILSAAIGYLIENFFNSHFHFGPP